MQQSLKGYLIVKEKEIDSTFVLPKKYDGQTKIAEVISSPKKSIYKKGDIVTHENAIVYYNVPEMGDNYFYVRENDINGIVKDGSVYATRDLVYFEVNEGSKHSLSIGDLKFDIDHEYNKFHKDVVTPFGIVHSVPLVATDSYAYGEKFIPIDIKKGDIVYAMHFLVHDDNKTEINGKTYYTQRYEECYCRVRNKVVTMLNNYNFIEPISEQDINIGAFIIKNNGKTNTKKGNIKYICNSLKELGTEIGDTILFSKDADYVVDFNGQDLFRINNLEILAKENKTTMELEALDDNVIVKQFPRQTEVAGGFVLPENSRFTPNKGEVISVGKNVDEIKVGDVVHFEGQFGMVIEEDETIFRILKKKHCFSKDK